MAGQVIGKTWIPEIPIRQNVDWGGDAGHVLTFSETISSVVFVLGLYRNGKLIIQLDETNAYIEHSSATAITVKIPKSQTAGLPKGPVTGNLLGTSAGVTSYYLTVSTHIE